MAKVKLNNIHKSYEKVKTVKDINLDIQDKEFIVLVGPSGCGKSTILRMIAGLEDITSGDIYIGENLVNDTHPKDRDIAMVFQNYALYPHMSVYENMAFGLKMRKFKKNEIDSRVQEAAKILDLTEYLDRKPRQLSGGQRQRVALGRAIVREPKVFLMDEPLSNLDAKLRVQMRAEIKKLHQKLQTTFIYVTHDQVEAMTMGDKIVVLKDGIMQQFDTAQNVYNYPENMFVASFIGSPAMNFINGEIIEENLIKFGDQSLILGKNLTETVKNNNLLNKNVILGLRPENFSLIKSDKVINANIELTEMLGSEQLAYFKINDKNIIAKLPSDKKIKKSLTLAVDIDKCLLFDKDSEKRYK